MKKLFSIIAFVCLALPAFAQNWTTVSASSITDLNQNKLAAGQLCFLITDQSDNPISVQIGGGGQALKRGYCSPVAAGAVTSFTVPNPATTSPSGIYYRVTVKDSSTGQEVLRYTGVTFSGATFSFDAYVPVIPGGSFAPLTGTTVSGNLSVTGGANISGTLTAGTFSPGTITSGAFTSNTANPAASGILRLASIDPIKWRNNANSADIALTKTGAAASNVPADSLDASGFGGIKATSFISSTANPASAGGVALASADAIKFRNNANSGDINGLSKNASDQISIGGAAGELANGPKNLNGFALTNAASATVTGALTAGSAQGVLNAATFTGADMGAKVNAAFAACLPTANTCHVMIPTGAYSYSTTINFPVVSTGPKTRLTCESGTALTYTGSGDGILVFGVGGESAVLGVIEGCLLIGTSSGANGIHIKAFNSLSLSGNYIRGFSTGNGVLNEGGNMISCDNKGEFDLNKVGWVDQDAIVGTTFQTVDINLGNCQFQSNTQFGYWNKDVGIAGGGDSGSSNKAYFFQNGTTSSNVNLAAAPTGAVRNAGGTVATFTCSTSCGISTGDEVLISSVTDTTFNGFCNATFISATSFSCANTGTGSATSGSGTSRQITGNVFLQHGNGNHFSYTGFENTAGITSPICNILVGDNNNNPGGTILAYNNFASAGSVVNSICLGNGQSTSIIRNAEVGTVTNLVNGIGAGTRGLYMDQPAAFAQAATNIFTGTNNGADNTYFGVGQGGSFGLTDINAQGSTIRGYGFNQLSGLNQDIIIRGRSGCTNDLNWQDSGGAPKGSISCTTGAITSNGGIVAAGTAAGLTGTGACATFSTQTGGSFAGRATCTGTTAASTLTIAPGLTAPTGWVCYVQDQTTRANLFQQTSTSTTSCTLTATSITQNDVFVFSAIAF